MELPPAKDIKPGIRFPVMTQNGAVEFRLLKFERGKGESKHALTWDGITKKQVLLHWSCSVFFRGNEFSGRFSLVSQMENGNWAVRIEMVIAEEEFWKDAKEPSVPLPGAASEYEPDPTDTYFFS